MNLFTYELKKIMFHQRGALYIGIYLIAVFAGLVLTNAPFNSAMQQYKSEYEWYLEKVNGPCTKDVTTYLEQEASLITEAKANRQTLLAQYYNGDIDQNTYQQKNAELNTVLEHQNGFEVIYQQYLYVCENKDNHYFLQTNGWSGLLNNVSFNFLLLLTILLIATPAFCSEYGCQMDNLILTAKEGLKSALCKILIISLSVILLCVISSSLRFGFYAFQYGLPNGNYPLQSLSYFGSSNKQISLLGSYVAITTFQCFGCLFLTLLLLFFSVVVKKYALTLLLGAVSMLLPYIGLPTTWIYRLPLPLPFFLGTDFFAGSTYTNDPLTGNEITAFQEIGKTELLALLGVSGALCLMAVLFVLRKNSNCWNIFYKKKHSTFMLLLCLLMIFNLSGCASKKNITVTYNFFESNTCGNYEVLRSDTDQNYSLKNTITGETFDLSRSPLFGVFSDNENITGYFCSDPYIYYTTSKTEEYIDRVGTYSTSFTLQSIIELNLETFKEKVIFEKITDSQRSLLGIEYKTSDKWEFLQYKQGFFLNEDSIFFIGNDSISKVNRKTEAVQMLDIPINGNLAFDGQNIFYLNEQSVLTKYNTVSNETFAYDSVIAYHFFLDTQGIYYIDLTDSNHVYFSDLKGNNKMLISDTSALSITCDQTTIYITPKDGGAQLTIPKKKQ